MSKKVPRVTLSDGNKMPVIGFGTFEAKGEDVRVAIDAGYRLFDGADFYGNEKDVGRFLADAVKAGKVKREELFVVSKVWPTWQAKGRPTISAKRTLSNLGLDYVDMLLIHWPMQFKQDDNEYHPKGPDGNVILDETIDLVDVWREFEDIKKAGLARSIGVSNFNSQQLDLIISNSSTVPAVNQVECHPYLNQMRLHQFCEAKGIRMCSFSPLAITGPNASMTPPIKLPLIQSMAEKYGVSTGQVVFRWLYQRGIVVFPKSSTKERIISNINIFDFQLTSDEMTAINGLDKGYRCHPHTEMGIGKHKNYPFSLPF